MKLYQDLAEYYFAIENCHRNIYDDIKLVLQLSDTINNPAVLDIGCGTGEHLFELFKKGFRCTGIDNSENMLKIARSRFPDAGDFILCDAVDFDFYNMFDGIISLFGSINYLIHDDDINKVLWNTWRAMKRDGFGLFEVWNAFPVQEIKEKIVTTVSTVHYNNLTIERQRGFTLLPDKNKTIAEVRYLYTVSDETKKEYITDKHIMRAFFKEEIEDILSENGFTITNIYSNSGKDQFSKTSNKLLIHFKKK